MHIIRGGCAFSAHYTAKIRAQIQQVLAQSGERCESVGADFVYFVQPRSQLNAREAEKLSAQLAQFLPPNPAYAKPENSDFHPISRIVTPRIGTISPWCTKATDILHRCGVDEVVRIERGVEWRIDLSSAPPQALTAALLAILYDPMTESLLEFGDEAVGLFAATQPAPLEILQLKSLQIANRAHGFNLSSPDLAYLTAQFTQLGRDPTDVELMMFAQVNSEHCRHKIFNAAWQIDGVAQKDSPFGMIRHTHAAQKASGGAETLVAYRDNAAVLAGREAWRLHPDPSSHAYTYQREAAHIVAKVETHNHPTAISPFAGAATGSGGEIRDEGATGRGSKPKAGMVGYSVSHLRLPDCPRAWENAPNSPPNLATPLQIMLEAPIGAASFNNEFGRPNIAGYFRTFEHVAQPNFRYAYHKPIMLAGGLGNIRPQHAQKQPIPDATPIVVIGGPAMLIGLGGGAASSASAGSNAQELDFASVQRGNAEMQRRCQEVIDACCARGADNPIISIHDVGAGGLCNAVPELIHDSARGGAFELRDVPSDEPGMTPLQIWCNESQERYILAIAAEQLAEFEAICARERCLYAVLGHAVAAKKSEPAKLVLHDRHFAGQGAHHQRPIDLPMEVLFGLPPKMQIDAQRVAKPKRELDLSGISLHAAAERVLSFPSVADKSFLISIGDRSVGGLVAREQMVGPWQVAVADVGVTASGYRDHCGEAIAVGERTPLALLNAPASGRMAVGEAVTNIAAADIADIADIKLSANWMAAAGEDGADADLYETVRAVALELCPALGIAIPVGKDSMSMRAQWQDGEGRECKAVAPLSLVVTAFSRVGDVRRTLTPELNPRLENDLWLLDLGQGRNRLGGSALAQTHAQLGDTPPDLDAADLLKQFFALVQKLNRAAQLLAYHDRSDGGLFATLCEMAFAARCGLRVDLAALGDSSAAPLPILFAEELGAVLQTQVADRDAITAAIAEHQLQSIAHRIGSANTGTEIAIYNGETEWLRMPRIALHKTWSETSWRMQRLRDNPDCADQEYAQIEDADDPGLSATLTFAPETDIAAPFLSANSRPKVAILREQGVNGQLEMAAAFDAAGFEAVDVCMRDLLDYAAQRGDPKGLDGYLGLAACGGFSFGDVLGAGVGWAKSILYHPKLRDTFSRFFARNDTFALGVCNGCQMLAALAELIPGAAHFPRFEKNQSEQFEARMAMLEIVESPSILLRGMAGSKFPISTAHGEGRARLDPSQLTQLHARGLACLRFVDNYGDPTETFPANPNGCSGGVTGFTSEDGRFTIMMPHPERVVRASSYAWASHAQANWQRDGQRKEQEYSPWIQIFRNARVWVG